MAKIEDPRYGAPIFICLACLFCLAPGIVSIFGANSVYNDWQSAPGKIMNTTYCGQYRRRAVEAKIWVEEDYFGEGEYHYGPPPKNPGKPYDLKPQYSVTYSFTTDVGQKITATTEYCTSPVPPLGGTDTVLYDPGNPSVGVISNVIYNKEKFGGYSATIFGIIAIAASGVCLYELCKERNFSSSDNTEEGPYNTSYNADGTRVTATNTAYSDNNPHDKV